MLLGEVWKEDLLCAQVSQRLKYSANCNLIPGSVTQDNHKVKFSILCFSSYFSSLRDAGLSPYQDNKILIWV